tara:strand:+ start:779 stop:1273 length:495 start_codon:yes stop_codon:yes gene_type:complete
VDKNLIMKNIQNLPLRLGVGVVLLNQENKVFVGKRIDNPENYWQMPQGGIDSNEDFLHAAKRELEEETGIKSVKIVKELNYWTTYNLPKNLVGKIWKGKYKGQKQKWFIMKFFGKNNEININTKNPEFMDWKWIKPSELAKNVVNFKIDVYQIIERELTSLKIN